MQGGILESDKQIIQYKRKMIEDAQNQRWYYREDGVIYPQTNPNLVLDIRVSREHRSTHRHDVNQLIGQLDQGRYSRVALREKIRGQRESVVGFSTL